MTRKKSDNSSQTISALTPSNELAPGRRNNYFDFLRAIAIIMVIGNHTCGVANLSFPNGSVNLAILQILKSGVPIFLAISGFFLCRTEFPDSRSYFRFLKKHLKRIYIPMIIFSIPFILGGGLSLRSILGRSILTLLGAYSVYYFIFLIAQYYILLPLLKRQCVKKGGLALCGFISAISIISVTYCNSILGMDLPLFIYAGACPVWIIFFALGCYFSANKDSSPLPTLGILLVVTLGLSMAESYWLETYHTAGTGIKLSVFMLSGVMIFILFSKSLQDKYNAREGRIVKLLNYITIYLCHIYLINLMGTRNLLTNDWYANWALITIVSVALVALADKLLPKKIGQYIGL